MALVSSVVVAVAVVVVVVELSGPEMLPCPLTSHFDFSERLKKKHIFDQKCLAQWLSGTQTLFWCRVLIRGDFLPEEASYP